MIFARTTLLGVLSLTLVIAAVPPHATAGSPTVPQLELQLVIDFLNDPVVSNHSPVASLW